MKRSSIAFVLALTAACGHGSSSAPTQTVPGSLPGTVETVSFHSAALGVDKHYLVYLPAGYATATARHYPTIYMLHGLGDDERGWIDGGKLDHAADLLGLQAIVVMPDGDTSFYANSVTPADRASCTGNPVNPTESAADYCVEHAAYEDYLTADLVGHIDATYRTIPEARARGVGGLSMGGLGALELGLRHRDRFAAVASHSGVDSLLYAGPFPYQAGQAVLLTDPTQWGKDLGPLGALIRGIYGPELANWKAHDPTTLVEQLADGDLAIYLDCGSDDDLGLDNQAQYLHEVLQARGVKHEWYFGPGGHNFDFWSQRIDDSLGFFARVLAPATP